MPTTPTLALPYPASSDPADVPLDMQELATRIETVRGATNGLASLDATGKVPAAQLPTAATVGYSTSLPASPTSGQEHILVDSTTNPTYQWRFRYNASSSSTYKWEFVGGTPAFATRAPTDSFLGTGNWVDAAGGPTWNIPRAGEYTVAACCQVFNSVGAALTGMGIALNETDPADPFILLTSLPAVNANSTISIIPTLPLHATAGDIRIRYYAGAGTGQAVRRNLTIWPKRL